MQVILIVIECSYYEGRARQGLAADRAVRGWAPLEIGVVRMRRAAGGLVRHSEHSMDIGAC